MEEEKEQALDKLKGLAFILDAVEISKESELSKHIYEREGFTIMATLCMEAVKGFENSKGD